MLIIMSLFILLIGCTWYIYLLFLQHKRDVMLLDISLELSSTIERKKLLEKIMTVTAKSLRAGASSIILLDPDTGELYFEVATGEKNDQVKKIRLKPGEGIAGWVATHGQSVLIPHVEKDPRWSSKVSDRSTVTTTNMICVPIQSNGALLGVLQVINKQGKRPFTKQDMNLLEQMSAPVAMALENMMLYEALEHSMQSLKETTEVKDKMESELKIAREIQRSFLPGEQYHLNRCELAATLMPTREVGGDFYHFFPLDEEHLLFCLGDVSDKGMPAALFMSAVMIWTKAKATDQLSPDEIITAMNIELSSEDSTMFATIFMGILNTSTGSLVYCDAGHCTTLLLRDSEVMSLTSQKGLPIGIMSDAMYTTQHIQLLPGDQLFLYSDGITEAENASGEWYGISRLEQRIAQLQNNTVKEKVTAIIEDVEQFAHGVSQYDDIAVMSVQFTRA